MFKKSIIPIFLLLILFFLFECPVTVLARSAIITYNANKNIQVAIVVGTSPDFTKTLKEGQQVTGQIGKNGIAQIDGLVPGKTYYFSAIGWDSDGNKTGFSPPIKQVIPAFKGFTFVGLPKISTDGKVITLSIKINDK